MAPTGEPLLSVADLRVEFPTDQGVVHAVDGVSLAVWPDEVVGIVGESGSGKTVTALSVLRLLPRFARVEGSITFRGRDVFGLSNAELRAVRGDRISLIFQDALTALNPLHRVGHQVAEAIRLHHPKCSSADADRQAVELLEQVGISNAAVRARQFPHEFSGGMRQRAMIAVAIANEPDVLIADEPTTALDVTTQAQVLELLKVVRRRTHSALLLITHDLGVVAGVADRVVVMYAGRVVETGSVEQVLLQPGHPYTMGLLASIPRSHQPDRRLVRISGQPPSMIDVPTGCAFHPRCPYAQLPDPCAVARPELLILGEGPESGAGADGHWAACHFAGRLVGSKDGAGAGAEP